MATSWSRMSLTVCWLPPPGAAEGGGGTAADDAGQAHLDDPVLEEEAHRVDLIGTKECSPSRCVGGRASHGEGVPTDGGEEP
jgi:hypothetical protein